MSSACPEYGKCYRKWNNLVYSTIKKEHFKNKGRGVILNILYTVNRQVDLKQCKNFVGS